MRAVDPDAGHLRIQVLLAQRRIVGVAACHALEGGQAAVDHQHLGGLVRSDADGFVEQRLVMDRPARLDPAACREDETGLGIVDLSLGGISLPNSWIGDLKGVDLVAENVETDPALQKFLAGIQSLEVHNGTLRLVLNK